MKNNKTGRPKKKPSESKTAWIEVRCEEAEKEAFQKASEAQGLALSAWIRQALRRTARKELEDIGLEVAFLNRL